jgi:hypothetical protein
VPEWTIETVKEGVRTAKEPIQRGVKETPASSRQPDYPKDWRRY